MDHYFSDFSLLNSAIAAMARETVQMACLNQYRRRTQRTAMVGLVIL